MPTIVDDQARHPVRWGIIAVVCLCLFVMLGTGLLVSRAGWIPFSPVPNSPMLTSVISTSSLLASPIVAVPTNTPPIPTEVPSPTVSPTATLIVYETKINQQDGALMVPVPAGPFIMGSNQEKDPFFWGAEAPEHEVTLEAYWIYQNEVTQGMYAACVNQKLCPKPETINHPVALQYGNPRFENYPVVMVTWTAASAYCQWAGGKLPTEAQWEKAARGTDGRLFPWSSNSSAEGLANYSTSSPAPVGSYPLGASPYGAYDMAGNVLEWVRDFFTPLYYEYSPLDNPLGPASGDRRGIRGGSFEQNEVSGLRTVARASLRPNDTKISVGFRCVVIEP